MKIVIIGNGPAAIKALEAIDLHVDVSSSRRPEVTVISSEKAKAYAPMFLIKYITGQLTEGQLLLTPEDQGYSFPARKIFGTRVVELKEENRKIVLEDGREIGFDKLLIASGSSPITPPISSLTRKGVFFLGRLGDAKNISRAVKQASDVIIIGAGAMGMEAAVAFDHRGKKIKVVELAGHILPQTLGPNPAEYARGKLEAQGIEFRLGEAVTEISGDERATGAVTERGKEIRGSVILITAGVRPNMDFLKSTAIKIDNGIIVNDRMETNIPDVYAAGDVAESRNLYGDYELVFNWYSAVSQGWIAGCNLMGEKKSCPFSPTLSALKEVDFPIISIGRRGNNGYEHFSYRDEKRGVLEEIYVRDNRIDCYQAIGTKDKAGLIYTFIMNRKRVDDLKKGLLGPGFNASRLIS